MRGTGQAGSVDPVPSGRRGRVIPALWRPSLIGPSAASGLVRSRGLCARGGGVSEVDHPIHPACAGGEVFVGSTRRERDRRGPGILQKRFGEAGEGEKTRLQWR